MKTRIYLKRVSRALTYIFYDGVMHPVVEIQKPCVLKRKHTDKIKNGQKVIVKSHSGVRQYVNARVTIEEAIRPREQKSL